MRATATDWPVSDAVIAGASVVGLVVVGLLLAIEHAPAPAAAGTIGGVAERRGSVRHRPADSLVWDEAERGDRLAGGESLFVGPGGAAAVLLDDGGRLELEENSLVVLEARRSAGEPATVTLRRGGVAASAAASGVRIRGASGEAALRPGAEVRVGDGAGGPLDVALLSGDAAVSGASVLKRLPVRLSAPRRSERVWFSGTPGPVALAWDAAAAAADTVEIARDAAFAERVASFPGARGAAEWLPPAAGTYWWRAVDGRRAARSEARALTVAEDRPPLPYAPGDGEVVFAPPGRTVPFWWTEVEGARAYVVEISASPEFEPLELSVRADRPGAWIEPRLPEGVYHWRVRAADPDRPAPPSRRSAFRLVHASVPDAPELLDPTLQVEREAP